MPPWLISQFARCPEEVAVNSIWPKLLLPIIFEIVMGRAGALTVVVKTP